MAANNRRQSVSSVSLNDAEIRQLLTRQIGPEMARFGQEVATAMNAAVPLNNGRWIVKTYRRPGRFMVAIVGSKMHTRFLSRREREAAKAFIKSKTVKRSIRLRRLPDGSGFEAPNNNGGISWAA